MRSQSAKVGLATGVLVTSLIGPAIAQNAPAPLRGKSIIVSWTENRLQRREGGGEFRPRAVPNMLQVYVSSEGRTFERRNVPGASKEGVGGGAIAGRAGSTRFQGNSLVVAGATRSGARMVMISFESGFSSCSVHVQVGHEAGTNIVKGTAMGSRQPIEFTMQGISGESCTIQSGNVFAQ